MSVFDSPPPSLPLDELVEIARRVFGAPVGDGTPIVALRSERDQNVRIGDIVLKVAHTAETEAALDLQHHVLTRLTAIDPSLPVPRPIGDGARRLDLTDGPHLVRAFTWLDGQTWADASTDAVDPATRHARRRSLGATMGRLSAALATVSHPAAQHAGFLWDLDLAIAELKRVHEKGVQIVTFPENPTAFGQPSIHWGHWDPLFTEITERNMTVAVHIGTAGGLLPTPSMESPADVGITLLNIKIAEAVADLLFSPLLLKFPTLRIMMSEGCIGWVPFLRERANA